MTLEFWRNLSLVWISIHLFVLCLLPLGIAFLAVRGMSGILGGTARGMERLRERSGRARARTEEAAGRATSAVIRRRSKAEKTRAAIRSLADWRSEQ